MNPLGLNEIREKFLHFFEGKEHLRLKSFSLVPQNDKSLLLINSGMAPMKPFFTGQEIPPSKRVATCQKCIRTGDIENVGITARHGTFFEMLGNFSFGDYFKEEIISWAWEFLTEVLEIPDERLYPSVYEEDDEAFDLWHHKIGLSKDKIVRLGKEDNFWEHGIGPCGPCSEIYFDKGDVGCTNPNCSVGCDCDRYVEIWNLVFTQFNKSEDGSYSKLSHPNIDTGMGLERLAAAMQNVFSIFDIDTIKIIRDHICKLAGVDYNTNEKKDVSIRVITDHIRSVVFMTADGVLPSNEGRGYVLRRLLRRAARHGKLLGITDVFLTEMSKTVIQASGEAYPELLEKQDYIFKVLSVEENRFYETLDQGMEILRNQVSKLKDELKLEMPGFEAFRLYDTFGFPLELTKEILEEEGLALDEKAFLEEMEKQKLRARSAREESTYMGAEETVYNKLPVDGATEFTGYAEYESDAEILYIIRNNEIVSDVQKNDEVSVILNRTSFYAESGGQKGDSGIIEAKSGQIEIIDCIKIAGGRYAHLGKVVEGVIGVGDAVIARVDKERRLSTARNHTATHLLQKALRDVLGSHVEQAGSSVGGDRLRFDFTHFAPMTLEEISRVEQIVNGKILDGLSVDIKEMNIEEARKLGAMALFGEKYGKTVRVVDISGYSIEFCGGTHLSNTSGAGIFKLLSETGVAAGVRRIEAFTGQSALDYYRRQDEKVTTASRLLKTVPDNVLKRIEAFMSNIKELTGELDKLKSRMSVDAVEDIIRSGTTIRGALVVVSKVSGLDISSLRMMGDQIRNKAASSVVVLASEKDGKVSLLALVTDNLVELGVHAGEIIKAAATVCGGGGGGRPNMAQAGGKDPSKINDALEAAMDVINKQLA